MPTLASLAFKPFAWAFGAGRFALTGRLANTTAGAYRGVSRTVAGKLTIPSRIAMTSMQTMIGAGVGAVAGAAGGYDVNSAIEGAAKGAVFGAMAGGAFSAARYGTLPAVKGAGRWLINAKDFGRVSLMEQMKRSGGVRLAKSGYNIASKGTRAAIWMAERPGLMLGGVATVMGGTAILGAVNSSNMQTMESPTLTGAEMSPNYNQQAVMATEMGPIGGGRMGSAAQMQGEFEYANWMQQVGKVASNSHVGRFAQSAGGLVQGLHAGRHGG